jgi:hypothetical protein
MGALYRDAAAAASTRFLEESSEMKALPQRKRGSGGSLELVEGDFNEPLERVDRWQRRMRSSGRRRED